MSERKLIVIEDGTDRYDPNPIWDANVKVVSGLEVVRILSDELNGNRRALEELLKNEGIQLELKRLGWVDTARLERVVENVVAIDRFYILEQNRNGFRGYDISEADLTKMPWNAAVKLAHEDNLILRVIDKRSLEEINPKFYKEYLEAKKRLKAKQTKSKKSSEKRAATKKAKELAKAKKLLEAEGIAVGKPASAKVKK